MSLAGAIILLVIGLLLVFLTVGILHVIGIICAVVGVVGLIFVLVAGHRSRL